MPLDRAHVTSASRRPGRQARPIEDRFWEKVDKTVGNDGCWIWLGTKRPDGYGLFQAGTFAAPKNVRAHRLSYELNVGPIPKGLLVRHSCDNPSCVNPAHLSVGTQKQNMEDMVARNRQRYLKRPVCKNGHKWEEETTAWQRNGSRICLVCHPRTRVMLRNNPRLGDRDAA